MSDWEYSTYSKVNPEVKKYFPFEKPRVDQLETISEIKEAIDRGYKYIILEAGTGTGKSVMAATLALMFNSTYILTVTKQLQDQYIKDFKNLGFKLVKGRGNFKCRKYLESNIEQGCDKGRCVIEGYRCEYSLNRSHDTITRENTCFYFYQKFVGMYSDVVISNYPYLFLELNYVEDFKKRKLMIFDEAHNLEDTVMNQLKLEFKKKDLKEQIGLDISEDVVLNLELGDYTDWVRFIKRVKDKYGHELNKMVKLKGKPGINEKISFLKLRINDCNRFIDHIQQDPSKWIFDYDRRFGVVEFKPIKVDNYAKNNFFKFGDICLFMSATILDYKLFAEWLGIKEDEIYAIRRESPFEVNRNPIKTYNDFNLSYGNLSKNAPKTIDAIKEILEIHKHDKGVIHTISHQCKNYLKKNISSKRMIDHNTFNRASQLEKFKNSNKPLVLVSPSMNEGVDLPGDECRFQIIYKIPYPSLADKQTKMRKNIDSQWYDYKTCLALVQTYGRGMRYEQDFCKTYFIDSRLESFIARDMISNNFLPKFFRKAINITPAVINPDEKVEFEPIELRQELVKENLDDVFEEIPQDLDISGIIKVDDTLSYKEKCDLKYELAVEGNQYLKEEDFTTAIEFYNCLMHHELFINDYHQYLKLSKAYHGAGKYDDEREIIIKFFKSGIYCRPATLRWFKKRLKKLAELGYFDISQLDDLEIEFNHRGKKNRKLSKIPVPFAKDISPRRKHANKNPVIVDPNEFDEFVNFDKNLSYDEKIQFKYNLILMGNDLIKKAQYPMAIAYYTRLLSHGLFSNDYHPYLKLYRAYHKDKQYEKALSILIEFFKSGIYCNDKKLKWFIGRLRDSSKGGYLDPSRIRELEYDFNEFGALNKDLADTPVPISLKIIEMFESEDEAEVPEIEVPKFEEDKNLKIDGYSKNYFNQLIAEITNQPEYKSYIDLTEHNSSDYISFENHDLVDEKANLINQGKLLEREDYEKAADFYEDLKKNNLFINDYYPYRRQCILFKNYIKDDQRDWDTIVDIFSKGVYLNKHQYIWLNNKIIELISKLGVEERDINNINRLLEDYEVNKENYEKVQNQPVPIAARIFKDENGLRVISQEKYDYIENIHYINELGTGYIRRGEYETAIEFHVKLFKQNIPYFKCRACRSFIRILKEMGDDVEFERLCKKYL